MENSSGVFIDQKIKHIEFDCNSVSKTRILFHITRSHVFNFIFLK